MQYRRPASGAGEDSAAGAAMRGATCGIQKHEITGLRNFVSKNSRKKSSQGLRCFKNA